MKDSTDRIFQVVANREMTSTEGAEFLMREREANENPRARFAVGFLREFLLPAGIIVALAYLLTGCAGTLDRFASC